MLSQIYLCKYSIHSGASAQSWCFVKLFWHVPLTIGLILQLLCSLIGKHHDWADTPECGCYQLERQIRGNGKFEYFSEHCLGFSWDVELIHSHCIRPKKFYGPQKIGRFNVDPTNTSNHSLSFPFLPSKLPRVDYDDDDGRRSLASTGRPMPRCIFFPWL